MSDRLMKLEFEPLEQRLVLDVGPLVISEFLAYNDTGLRDADGDYSDWIEIHNPSDAEVSLAGWHLTDDAEDLEKWEFPAVSMVPGEYLLVFASEKDRSDPAAELHTNFRISGSGEYLALVKSDGTVAYDYAPEFPEQFPDTSYGLTQDLSTLVPARTRLTYKVPEGGDAGLGTSWTEPGFDNSGWVGTDPPPPVLITEAGTGDPDFVEIQNVSEDAVNTSGWFVVVNNAYDIGQPVDVNAFHATLWRLPDSMAPGEVLYRSDINQGLGNWWGENIFWRSSGSGWVMLVDDNGSPVDFAVWGYSAGQIGALAITVDNFDLTAEGVWTGDGIPPDTGSANSHQRIANSDNDIASDFTVAPLSMGIQNTDLEIPFPSGPATGIGFSADPSDFGGAIRTDVEGAMRNINASVWTRIPFDVEEDLALLETMRLWIKYDDGFTAYLNGQKIASRNAPAAPQWNSTATADRPDAQAMLFEDIDVSAQLGLLQAGPNLLAVHGLNDNPANGEFLLLPKLVATSSQAVERYMAIPTPGQPNETATAGAGPQFSHPGGTFTEPFSLELTAGGPDTPIRYTLDERVPDENSPLYTMPIPIDTSVQVRARAFPEGMEPSPVVTETYLWLAANMQTFSSELPLVVVDTFGDGIGSSTFQDGYMTIYEPVDDGNPLTDDFAAVTNPHELDTRIGIKTRGSSSGGWPKHHYGIEAWANDQDEDREIRPFGMAKESDWILGSFYTFDRALMRNPLAFELSNQVGRYAVRTKFVEVFLNSGSRELSYSDYMGVYAFMEKIKRDPERVDVKQLELSDTAAPDVTGGYILKIDRRDPGDSGFSVDGLPYNYVEPKERELEGSGGLPPRPQQRSYITNYIRDFHSAVNGPNYAHPLLGYPAYIDVESWIDHSWLNILPMNVDAYRLSGYMFKDRNGLLQGGPVWDFDRSMESTDGRDNRYDVWDPTTGDGGTKYFTYGYWDRLFLDDDFGQRWIDRWHELREDEFSTENIHAIIDGYKEEITQEAASRNFAKWTGVPPRGGSWTWEVNHLKDWLRNRANWIDGQFLAMPTPSRQGGQIDPGFQLTLSGPAGSNVYYTTDGSDPRAPGGAVAGNARVYSGPITLGQSTIVTARAWDGVNLSFNVRGPTGGWSAPVKESYYIDAPAGVENLAVTEINYHPYDPTEEELAVNPGFLHNDFEFFELRNIGDESVLMAGVQLSNGVSFAFSEDLENVLAPGEHIVLANNPQAFQARYGTQVVPYGQYEGLLRNEGERVAVLDRFGEPILDFAYDDRGDWPGRADGKGASLELIDPAAVPADDLQRTAFLEDGDNWRSSSEYGGTPGSPGSGPLGDVLVNEVLTRTPLGEMIDAIELFNTTAADIELGGWYLSDSWGWESSTANGNYKKFLIPPETVIPAGGYLVFDEADFNPSGGVDPELNPYDFALNGVEGDDVWLMEADAGGTLVRFVDHVDFGAAAPRESLGRWPNGQGDLYPMITPTIDKQQPENGHNSGPRIGPVIFSEVHYNPSPDPGDEDLEFVEIYNPTAEAIDLTEWRIRRGIEFDFIEGTMLAPRSTLVIVPFELSEAAKLAAFRDHYGITDQVAITGGYSGLLENAGETVRLRRPGEPVGDPPEIPLVIPRLLEDEVRYSPLDPWPTAADGGGSSLQRVAPDAWGNTHQSWTAAVPNPGTPSFPIAAAVVGRQVFYNNSFFDGNNATANAQDAAAIATDKTALRPGQTATFANYTSFTGGINGLMVDVDGLPAGAQIGLDDFRFRVGNDDNPDAWDAAAAPASITVAPGQGTGGSDRITLIWADNAIAKQWLQVTVLATADTDLAQQDVFYFGNAMGETGNSPDDAKVNAADMLGARDNQRSILNPAPIDFNFDFNRDQRVNSVDMLVARNHVTHLLNALKLITVPGGKAAAEEVHRAARAEPVRADWIYQFQPPSQQSSQVEKQAADEVLLGYWP